ncbi:PREDICTED: uncharacterized protein LOC108557695 [Nicrophorus vespilloides]|uniref:Uncharacterized protein LOC108557695 n=1 Tax=Nicrophorus vespilloides TaxID=110193 RepID=A0ABM1M5G8_NICVS|nr:PREDICTED: uncharacterized protein LOC108557695 [Nicrophorus vespilloides]
MPRNRKNFPRLLTHVLQAVADLREPQGSTVRKILDQVQTAINISNIRPKPRNVVMQVRRAIKHGIDNGVLKQRAGKIQLTLGSMDSGGGGVKKTKANAISKPSRRSRRLNNSRKNRVPFSEATSGYSFTSLSDYSLPRLRKRNAAGRFDISEKILESRRRRRRKGTRRRGKSRRRVRKRRRDVTPMPELVDEDVEHSGSEQHVEPRSRHQFDYNQDKVESNHSEHEQHEERRDCSNPCHECDNPDCLCNLKQEPDDIEEPPFNSDYL